MIAADADAIESRHPLGRVVQNIRHDPHARLRRINVGVSYQELLQNVILNRPHQLAGLDSLFLGGNQIHRHDRQHGSVHGHRNTHLIQRDAVEQNPHVFDAVDRHTSHADITSNAGMVRVIAPMGCQVKCDT